MAIPDPPSVPIAERDAVCAAMRELLNVNINAVESDARWLSGEAIFLYMMSHLDFMRANILFSAMVYSKIDKFICDGMIGLKKRQKCGLYLVKLSPHPSWRARKFAAEYIRKYGDDILEPMEE